MKKKEEGVEDANQTKEQIKDEKAFFSQNFRGRGRGRGGRDSGRSGRGSNFERGQSSQQNWLGHLAKDCRIEKKVEETTNLTLEAEANEGFLLMAQNEINSNDNVWYLDSGAINHMCGHKHLFKEMRKIEDGNVSFGDASKVKVEGKGMIRYLQKDGLIGSIQDVYYVPNLKTNILSLEQLTEKGYSILMKERILYLKDKLGHLIARVEMERNRMYKLNLINVREKYLQVNVEDKASLWHLRFGHLHHAGLKRSMHIALISKNKEKFIDETLTKPPVTDPLYAPWIRCNTMIRFSHSDTFRISDIQEDLYKLRQSTFDVSNYFTQLNILWDELDNYRPVLGCSCAVQCSCGAIASVQKYREQDYVICFLNELNEKFTHYKTNHTAETYFVKPGFPPGFKRKGKSQGNDNTSQSTAATNSASEASQQVPTNSSFGFSLTSSNYIFIWIHSREVQ
ncbi:hypothetical protein KIW84_042409 [Lathyrus oleraceus]|uniref:Retrovirus-related Pol polyprotein from transposon TNT 1-94-like beta-barrel domain-containing protein n=1 Tax=Pisum sativum TaxID=3888 RepID=A0A9D4XEA1_PEA|nr:hypothetical protein KIW84_042409 [Pisum sativum]